MNQQLREGEEIVDEVVVVFKNCARPNTSDACSRPESGHVAKYPTSSKKRHPFEIVYYYIR